LALPTTPIGVIVTFFARKRLRTPLGQMGTAMAVVGAVGWVLIVLEFVLIG
jgi:hypothetical protein